MALCLYSVQHVAGSCKNNTVSRFRVIWVLVFRIFWLNDLPECSTVAEQASGTCTLTLVPASAVLGTSVTQAQAGPNTQRLLKALLEFPPTAIPLGGA